METGRIAKLLAPYFDGTSLLNAAQLEQVSIYIDLLARWNARINLTAIRTPEEIVTRHFGESFFAACHLFPQTEGGAARAGSVVQSNSLSRDPGQTRTAEKWSTSDARSSLGAGAPAQLVDIGSGAGFPGLPIKIWASSAAVTLIESNHKKVAFLREVIRALTLIHIDVFPARAEEFPAHSAGTVTLRAVEHFTQILPTAARLLAPMSRLALLIGQSQVPEATRACPHLSWSQPIPIPGSKATVLAVAKTNSDNKVGSHS